MKIFFKKVFLTLFKKGSVWFKKDGISHGKVYFILLTFVLADLGCGCVFGSYGK